MAELFGFNITRVKPKTDPKQQFSMPQAEDGTQVVAAGVSLAVTSIWRALPRLSRI